MVGVWFSCDLHCIDEYCQAHGHGMNKVLETYGTLVDTLLTIASKYLNNNSREHLIRIKVCSQAAVYKT